MPDGGQQASPQERLQAAYADAESRTARAFEDAVGTTSFGGLLARSAENVAALSRIGSDLADTVLRNLRVAGRSDITRLARQLHRTEDKLERVLQEVEALRDELAAVAAEPASSAGNGTGTRRSTRAGSGNGAGSGRGGGRSGATRRRTGS